MMLDLRREAARAPMPKLDRAAITPRDRRAAIDNWRARMVSEHASARVFAALLGPMMKAGLPSVETRRVSEMAQQELDHGLLCARVLASFGEEAVAELPRLDDVPRHEDASSPIEVVLRNVISIGCCSETVAVALVATELDLAGPPQVRRVLQAILRDEIKHARLGWRLLARVAKDLDPKTRRSLDEYLVDVFDHQIAFHAPFLVMPCASDAAIAIGAPHGESNWLVFVDTMTGVIVPGLEQCGLAAKEAWTEASRVRPRS